MEELSPFKFGCVYYFFNKEIKKMKFHIYVGTLMVSELAGTEEHHFFLINTEANEKFSPHHPIFVDKKVGVPYPFLKYPSYVGCRKTFLLQNPNSDDERGRLSQTDMEKIVAEYQNGSPNREIVHFMNEYLLENPW